MIESYLTINENHTIQLINENGTYSTCIQKNNENKIQQYDSRVEAYQNMLLYFDKETKLELEEHFTKQTFYNDLEEVLIYYYNQDMVEKLMNNESFIEEAYDEWCMNEIHIADIDDFRTMIHQISQDYRK